MKLIANTLKVKFLLVFLIAFVLNARSQTTLYQTGFENIKDSTMLGSNAAYAAAKNDGWMVRVNDSTIQATKASATYCFSTLRATDEFRNAWTVADAWHYWHCCSTTDDSTTACAKAIRPISHHTLSMSAYWGATGTTFYERESCLSGFMTNSVNGFTNYFTDLITDRCAYRVIPTTGYTSITVTFQWKCNGQANNDYGQLGYSTDGGTNWTWIITGGTANGLYYGQQSVVQNATVIFPAACDNQSNLAIGFRFKCAGNGPNQDLNTRYPGFMVDNLVVKGTTGGNCTGVTINANGQPVSTSSCSTTSANFSVTASGDATISYQWQVSPSWTNLANNAMYSGVTTSALIVTKPTATLQYRCIASNCAPVTYATSNTATLTLLAPVKINPAFHNQTQCTGDTVKYSLSSTGGTGPFSYQWLLNESPVTDGSGGTTSLYYNYSVSGIDAGNYSCVISNTCNKITGNVASLTVVDCPRNKHKIAGYVRYANSAKTPMSSKFDSTTTYVYLYNSGDTLINHVQTNDNGYYEFVNVINGTYYVTGSSKKAWGGSNPTDALLVNRDYIAVRHITDSLYRKAGDVDSNKVLNPTDALIIMRRFIGALKKYPKIKDWKFEKIKVVMSGSDLLSQNFRAECSGDVNGSYSPSLIPGKIIYTPINNEGTMNINTGRQFEIPVYLNDNAELGAIGIKLKMKNEKLKIIDVHSDIDGLIYNITDEGVNIAWAATDNSINVNPDKALFRITAIYSGRQAPTSSFQISPESEIADIDANIISTDKLFMPEIAVSSQQPAASLICYPNPFNNITNIEYRIPEDLNVKINVYNVLGEKVAALVTNERQQAGKYTVKFDGTNLKQGIYYLRCTMYDVQFSITKTEIMMIAR